MHDVPEERPVRPDRASDTAVSSSFFTLAYRIVQVNDTMYTELVYIMFSLMWGLWNSQTWIPIHMRFAEINGYNFGNVLCATACFYGSVGLGLLFYDIRFETKVWRKTVSLHLCCFWAVVFYLCVRDAYFFSATVVYPFVMLGEAWIFWRIRPKNESP